MNIGYKYRGGIKQDPDTKRFFGAVEMWVGIQDEVEERFDAGEPGDYYIESDEPGFETEAEAREHYETVLKPAYGTSEAASKLLGFGITAPFVEVTTQ